MNKIEETKYILKSIESKTKKKYGQNFLINDDVLDNIISVSNITKKDYIIEIGPGLGFLTEKLLEKAGKVLSIEIDKDFIDFLKDRFRFYDNFDIINEDFLQTDLSKVIRNAKIEGYENIKVIANIPYYITTPIVLKILESEDKVDDLVIMVQKEVAERFSQNKKNSNKGSITFVTEYYAKTEIAFIVCKENFYPVPKVDSAILKMQIRKDDEIKKMWGKDISKDVLFNILHTAFLQKRKTFLNSISSTNEYSKTEFEEILKKLNIYVNIRPEKLTLEEYIKITKMHLKK